MSNPISIDVVSDVICPWCFLGKRRLERALSAMADTAVKLRWRPFQLDPTIPEGGIPREDYVRRKFGSLEALKSIHEPLVRMGAEEGIGFRFERITQTPNTIDAHRLIRAASARGFEEAIVERLFQLYFLEGADVGNITVLQQAAIDVGFDPGGAQALFAGDEGLKEIQEEIATAVQMGVTGVPTFIFGNRYAVVGAQEPRIIAGAIARVRVDFADSAPADGY